LEGLLHISELAEHKVESPEEIVKVGDEIEVKILRVDPGERKIGLSRKQLHVPLSELDEGETATEPSKPKERELRGGTGSGSGPLVSMPDSSNDESE
jgi:small subunit ribosomal protein S1